MDPRGDSVSQVPLPSARVSEVPLLLTTPCPNRRMRRPVAGTVAPPRLVSTTAVAGRAAMTVTRWQADERSSAGGHSPERGFTMASYAARAPKVRTDTVVPSTAYRTIPLPEAVGRAASVRTHPLPKAALRLVGEAQLGSIVRSCADERGPPSHEEVAVGPGSHDLSGPLLEEVAGLPGAGTEPHPPRIRAAATTTATS